MAMRETPKASSTNGSTEHPTRSTTTIQIFTLAMKPAVTAARSSTNWAGRSRWTPNSAIVRRVRSCMVRNTRDPDSCFGKLYADSLTVGAPFQWAAIFHKEDINFTQGHHDLGWYESSEKTTIHKLPCKVSCAYCRTPIMDEGRNMILLFPTLINFKSPEDRKNFEPRWALSASFQINHNKLLMVMIIAAICSTLVASSISMTASRSGQGSTKRVSWLMIHLNKTRRESERRTRLKRLAGTHNRLVEPGVLVITEILALRGWLKYFLSPALQILHQWCSFECIAWGSWPVLQWIISWKIDYLTP